MKSLILLLLITYISGNVIAQKTGIFNDPRDGQTYGTVQIGNQTWMAENLNFKTESESWCYDNLFLNCERYGRLYSWQAALSACPPGWHLPSDSEWTQLINHLGAERVAGGKLKSTSLWNHPNTGANNSSRFTALPGGSRDTYGSFKLIVNNGFWWSSSEFSSTRAWHRYMVFNTGGVTRSSYDKSHGFSVRCVRD